MFKDSQQRQSVILMISRYALQDNEWKKFDRNVVTLDIFIILVALPINFYSCMANGKYMYGHLKHTHIVLSEINVARADFEIYTGGRMIWAAGMTMIQNFGPKNGISRLLRCRKESKQTKITKIDNW